MKALVVDDDAFMRRGLSLYLTSAGFEVVVAANEASGWQLAINENYGALVDVAVIDIAIPPENGAASRNSHNYGIRLARRIKRAYPQVGIVLFSAYEDRRDEVVELLRDGVKGLAYILKGSEPAALLEAIGIACSGHVHIDPEVTNARALADEVFARLTPDEQCWVGIALRHFNELTDREMDVIARLASSSSVESITTELVIAPKTVNNHLDHIFGKLGLSHVPAHLRRHTLLTKACMIHDLKTPAL